MEFPGFDKSGEVGYYNILNMAWLRYDGKKRNLYMSEGDGEYRAPSTLHDAVKILGNKNYILIDRNIMVNMEKIISYRNGVIAIGTSKFKVSRARKTEFESAYQQFLSN